MTVSSEDDSGSSDKVVTASNKDTPIDKELLVAVSIEDISKSPDQEDAEGSTD